MFELPNLDHVQVAAPRGCEAQARRFYGAVVGLPELQKPEPVRARGGVWFALSDGQLHIGVEEPFTAAHKAHPAFRWTDAELQAVAGRLADAGAPVRWDEELPGIRRFFTTIRGATGWSSWPGPMRRIRSLAVAGRLH